MSNPVVKVYCPNTGFVPKRSTPRAAGYDIMCPDDIVVDPDSSFLLDTQMIIDASQWEQDLAYFLVPRSSSAKRGYRFGNTIGLIEATEYCGPNDTLKVSLVNTGIRPLHFEEGEKIGQLVFFIPEFPTLEYCGTIESHPGGKSRGGFGSTGK